MKNSGSQQKQPVSPPKDLDRERLRTYAAAALVGLARLNAKPQVLVAQAFALAKAAVAEEDNHVGGGKDNE